VAFVHARPLRQPMIGVQAMTVVPSKNSPGPTAHVKVLVPVSVQALPPHGLGTQSLLSMQPPVPFVT